MLTRTSLLPDKIISSITLTNAYTVINDVHIQHMMCINNALVYYAYITIGNVVMDDL